MPCFNEFLNFIDFWGIPSILPSGGRHLPERSLPTSRLSSTQPSEGQCRTVCQRSSATATVESGKTALPNLLFFEYVFAHSLLIALVLVLLMHSIVHKRMYSSLKAVKMPLPSVLVLLGCAFTNIHTIRIK